MLWEIDLVEKGSDQKRGIDKIFESKEIGKVLSMDIPVCLVVELPKRSVTLERPQPDFTDLLLCFPCSSCVHGYLYSLKNDHFQFRDLGKYGSGEEYYGRDEEVKRYQYAVSLRPFLHGQAKPSSIIQFRFPIQRVGFDVVEITTKIEDKNREKEWLNIDYYECANKGYYLRGEEKQHIAKLIRKKTKNGFIWAPVEEKPEIKELPFVQGYMTEEK